MFVEVVVVVVEVVVVVVVLEWAKLYEKEIRWNSKKIWDDFK